MKQGKPSKNIVVVHPVQQDGHIGDELTQCFDRGRIEDRLDTAEVRSPLARRAGRLVDLK